jgi:hypothetical protein
MATVSHKTLGPTKTRAMKVDAWPAPWEFPSSHVLLHTRGIGSRLALALRMVRRVRKSSLASMNQVSSAYWELDRGSPLLMVRDHSVMPDDQGPRRKKCPDYVIRSGDQRE